MTKPTEPFIGVDLAKGPDETVEVAITWEDGRPVFKAVVDRQTTAKPFKKTSND